ncbi:TIGR02466 family protein [Candidatus Pelagibacter bacterium nBUS_49]|uniref:TIGR02466 family protein n=1 Tax=Candidatus Pelagibacter bacterium nBUS_49 TaxID=3374196 RepID=UPI003EC10D6F
MNNPEISLYFPEPVLKYKFEDYESFNKDLRKYIYELQKESSSGQIKSNRGGWHSPNFKLTDKNSIQFKFGLKLQKYILKSFQTLEWKTENKNIRINSMWAIINKKDDYNVVHTHPNSYLSAAYYVSAPKNCGRFQVESLNIAKRHFYPEVLKNNELNANVAGLEVKEGDLLMFPGYLPHKVAMNESDEDRIVISFNVGIK